jgi:hypothetical protein
MADNETTLREALADNDTILREALEWYAEPTQYAVTQSNEPRSVAHWDGGNRAREALTRASVEPCSKTARIRIATYDGGSAVGVRKAYDQATKELEALAASIMDGRSNPGYVLLISEGSQASFRLTDISGITLVDVQ